MSAEAIREKLLGKFREVTGDRIERLMDAVAALGDDANAAREEIARELHTLKGEARMMGFVAVSKVVHLAEELLEGGVEVVEELEEDSPLPRAIHLLCDAIPGLLREPPSGGELFTSVERQLQELRDAAQLLAAEATGDAGEAAEAPEAAEGADPEASTEAPGGEAPEDRASEEEREAEVAAARADGAEQPAAQASKTRAQAAGEAGGRKRRAPRAEDLLTTGSIRVHLDALDEIAGLAGDIVVEGGKSGVRVQELRVLLNDWSRLADSLIGLAERTANGSTELVERVETEVHRLRTDAFRFYHRHSDSVDDVRRLLARLSERIAEARLMPLSGVFAGLPEAARQLAEEHGKLVECKVFGGRTGVDKSILPSLSDPLVHLLRNAIDHGLETPEERRAAGKPATGTITVSARAEGDRLQVILEDDGRGIDVAKVRATAVQRKLLTLSEAAALSPRSIIDFVFHPGLSTREETSEISGRGIGLDVVRSRVASWGGTVEVESEPGRGTRFILKLPQSLTLMKALLFRLDDDVFGVPAVDVEGVGRIDPDAVEEIAGIRAIRHRDRLLPIVPLGPLFALNGGPQGRRPTAVFLRQGNDGAAIVVDGFVGDRDVTVKAPGAFLKGMRFLSGAAALEDGRVALLLSTSDLLQAARTMGRALASVARRKLKVLLADDSLIAREAEAALLRAQGHEVVEAGDGEEAWQKLQSETFDLLITDVQMPVLDGIGLTRRVKSSQRLRKMPVAILSSLSAPQDRRRGVEAGAEGYLGKSELNPDSLAALIERLCGVGG